ncbi:MAG: hemolysin family protein [Actinobacteria bacterium]|nr:hemolysin family protein [Actinomycetota bacterium]
MMQEFSALDGLMLAGVLALWLLAGFFALSETSLTRVNRVKAQTLAEEKRRGAVHLTKLVEHPEKFLSPLLLLILLCHLVAATLLGVVAGRLLGGLGLLAVTIGQVAIVFVFFESAPKTWAVQHTDRASLMAAPVIGTIVAFPPLRLMARALISFTNLVLPGKGLPQGPYVSEQELLAMADAAVEEEVIEREERALIHSIIEFGDTVTREVMVPRPDMVAVEGRDRVADALEIAMAAGFSRIPVYEQGIDDVQGVLYTKDLMRAIQEGKRNIEVRELKREALFVPETKRVAELLREMQREKRHIAIVVDEYGGTAGLVTLEDLIEELIGEIQDEFDVEEPVVEPLPDGGVRVSARMPVDEVNELIGGELPEGDWDTIGGLVFNLLGHVPTEGEKAQCDGRTLTAEKVQGRRIGRVRISARPEVHEEGLSEAG